MCVWGCLLSIRGQWNLGRPKDVEGPGKCSAINLCYSGPFLASCHHTSVIIWEAFAKSHHIAPLPSTRVFASVSTEWPALNSRYESCNVHLTWQRRFAYKISNFFACSVRENIDMNPIVWWCCFDLALRKNKCLITVNWRFQDPRERENWPFFY